MAAKTFPKPAKPHSLKKIVKKIMADPDYAKFIHGQVRKARKGDAAAAAMVEAHFKPQRAELLALNRSVAGPACNRTNPTTLMLLDFAEHV